jgi:hypothetical protein
MPKNSKIEIIFIASILSCVFWWRHMFGLTTFPYDYEFYHFPHWKYIYDSIASASFPFYDPYVYSGMPYLEETGSMLFYLPVDIFLILRQLFPGDLTVHNTQFFNIAHYAILYIGIFLWSKNKGSDKKISHILALACTFSGVMISNAQHAAMIASIAYAPFLFMYTEKAIVKYERLHIALIAINLSMIHLAGFMPMAIVIDISWAVYVLINLFSKSDIKFSFLTFTKTIYPFFISFIIFLLICAPLYLNALSEKIPDLLPLQGSSHFTSLITLFAPNAIYNFSLENYKALGDPTTTYYFSGVIIFIALGIIGDKKMILSNNSFIAFMIIFLLSRNLFFINNIIQHIPLIGSIYRPHLFQPLCIMFLCISLAGISDKDLKKCSLLGGIIYLILILLLLIYIKFFDNFNILNIKNILLFSFPIFFTLILLGKIGDAKVRKNFMLLTCILAFLGHASIRNSLWMNPNSLSNSYSKDYVDGGNRDFISKLHPHGNELYRVIVDQKTMGGPFNTGFRVFKIDSVNGLEPNLDFNYRAYLLNDFAKFYTDRTFGDFNLESNKFSELNVKYYITRSKDYILNPNFRLIFDGEFKIFEYLNFAPRFRMDKICSKDDHLKLLNTRPGFYRFEIKTSCDDAVLHISERTYRGWNLFVNGKFKEINLSEHPIGLTSSIDKGSYIIELSYVSPNFRISLYFMLLGVLLLVFIGIHSFFFNNNSIRKACP